MLCAIVVHQRIVEEREREAWSILAAAVVVVVVIVMHGQRSWLAFGDSITLTHTHTDRKWHVYRHTRQEGTRNNKERVLLSQQQEELHSRFSTEII